MQLKIQLAEKEAERHRAEELTQNALAAAHAANAAAISQEQYVIRLKLEQLENADNGADDQTIVCPSIPAPLSDHGPEDAKHFKVMPLGRAGGGGDSIKDRDLSMKDSYEKNLHYVVIGDSRTQICEKRKKSAAAVEPGDHIHMYRGGGKKQPKNSKYYHGIAKTKYVVADKTNIPDDVIVAWYRDAEVNRHPNWFDDIVLYSCEIIWDDPILFSRLPSIKVDTLMGGGRGTVIHLKNMH